MSEKSLSASTSNGRVGDITDAKCLHMVANSKAADLIVAGAFVKSMRGSVIMPNEWISVKDRLPDVGIDVLVYYRNECDVARYSDTYRCFFAGMYPCENVTHWMPLPKTPKETESLEVQDAE